MTAARRILPVEPLTRVAFAPYGELIDPRGIEPETINAGTAQKYAHLAGVDIRGGGVSQVGETAPLAPIAAIAIYRAQPRTLPMPLLEIERHPLGSQAFVPLQATRYLVVVAGHESVPAPGAVRLFLATGQQGVNLHAGVWHHALLALDREAEFLVVERASPEGNLDRLVMADWQLWVGERPGDDEATLLPARD